MQETAAISPTRVWAMTIKKVGGGLGYQGEMKSPGREKEKRKPLKKGEEKTFSPIVWRGCPEKRGGSILQKNRQRLPRE